MKSFTKKCTLILASLLCAVCFVVAWHFTPAFRGRAETSGESSTLGLYDLTPTSVVSQLYPATEPYFAKPATIALGDESLQNNKTYRNALQVLAQANGFYSSLTYDISAYDYDYFTVTVGNRSRGTDFTNEITYSVLADEVVLASTSHPLQAYEVERLACKIPAGAQTLELRGTCAVKNVAFSECNWANPILSNFTAQAGTTLLKDVPVSGNNAATGQEEYAVKSASLNDGNGGAITDDNAITGAIHGNYGSEENPVWKFSADYDISGKRYTRFTADVGMLFNETHNNVIFTLRAVGGTSGDLAVSPAMDGTTYHHFDVEIPEGTTKIQIWAKSASNAKAFGNLAICNATLHYESDVKTPAVHGEVARATQDVLTFGDSLPALRGEFRVNGATVAGSVSLDGDQQILAGTHAYRWTFTATQSDCYTPVTGTIELTAERGNGYISLSETQKDYVLERGSGDVSFALKQVPETLTLQAGQENLAAEHYVLDAQAKTLVLKASYLETLEKGDHVFKAVCENGDFTLTVHVKDIADVQPASLCLYTEEYETITSLAFGGQEAYFEKLPSVELGKDLNKAPYANALRLLVRGPFGEDASLGTYYCALTYDISHYRYNYFSVTVGNTNCDIDDTTGEISFTNRLLYKVMVDGKVVAQTSHALASFETERLTCKIPAGAREIRLHAQSEDGTAYGEANWANPVLSVFELKTASTAALKDMPVSGNNTAAGQEKYAVGAASLNDGKGGRITDENAITGAIHGNYGNEENQIWKFSADYDISGGQYNRFTADVGMLNNETQNKVVFTVKAIGGTNGDLAVSPAIDGTTYHHFDIQIPEGTTKIQIWAKSQSNTKAYGELAVCNATLYAGGKITPVLLGAIEPDTPSLQWGDELPGLKGNFTAEKATLQGTLALDAGQEIVYGTKAYAWTFTPLDRDAYETVTGTVELTAGKRVIDMSGIKFEDKEATYDGTEKTIVISGTLPAFVTAQYDGNKRTAAGTTEAIVNFVIADEYKDLYEPVQSMIATLTVKAGTFVTANSAKGEYTLKSGADVSYQLLLDAVNATVKYNGQALDGANYAVEGDKITLKAAYLDTLEAGEHTFSVETEGGAFTLSLTVSQKQGGCASGVQTGLLFAAAMLALGAVAVVARRRKHDEK